MKLIKQLSIIIFLLLISSCSSMSDSFIEDEALEETKEQESILSPEEKHLQLAEQVKTWTEAEPNIERILGLESDMQFIIEQLSLLSDIDDNPLEAEGVESVADVIISPVTDSSTPAVDGSPNKTKNPCNSRASGHCFPTIGIHIAAFEDSAYISKGWEHLKKSLPKKLNNKKPLIENISISNNIYYSLRLGPFSSTNTANALCNKIKANNNYCSLVEYKGVPINKFQ